jgi:aryl-alcohol dehydrogenase-like predicted oxidoreductase
VELSSLGLGTYLGEPDAESDARYTQAALAFSKVGGSVFDTAANYRMGRSERSLGMAFRELKPDDFFISTKAGYLPMGDGETQETPRQWFERTLLKPGVLSTDDVVDNCHAMTPKYLAHQLEISRRALGVDTIDLFHLHNPEQQLPRLGPEPFYERMARAFEACESFRMHEKIRAYGVATWNGFRVAPNRPDHLSLERLLKIAESIGGPQHGFRWIQAPLNLALPEIFLKPSQSFGGKQMPLLEAAQIAGVRVQTSASIMQGQILSQVSEQMSQFKSIFSGCETPAQIALQFTRSCPGVTVALCGMSRIEHVNENVKVMKLLRVEPEMLSGFFG